MNNEMTENAIYVQDHLIANGFELCGTGGGCYAFAKELHDKRVVMVCDNGNNVDNLSDDDFIVALQDADGFPIADYCRVNGKTQRTDHADEGILSTVDPTCATVASALIALGVQS